MNFPVFDFHCDTALKLLGKDVNQAGNLRKNNLHIDLERASKLGGYAQCFACYTTPYMQERFGVSPIVVFERELATIQREVDRNKDLIAIAYTPEEIEDAINKAIYHDDYAGNKVQKNSYDIGENGSITIFSKVDLGYDEGGIVDETILYKPDETGKYKKI